MQIEHSNGSNIKMGACSNCAHQCCGYEDGYHCAVCGQTYYLCKSIDGHECCDCAPADEENYTCGDCTLKLEDANLPSKTFTILYKEPNIFTNPFTMTINKDDEEVTIKNRLVKRLITQSFRASMLEYQELPLIIDGQLQMKIDYNSFTDGTRHVVEIDFPEPRGPGWCEDCEKYNCCT